MGDIINLALLVERIGRSSLRSAIDPTRRGRPPYSHRRESVRSRDRGSAGRRAPTGAWMLSLPPSHRQGSFLFGFVPTRHDALFQIHIRAYASASDPNLAVVAAFRGGQSFPLLLTRRAMSDNKRVIMEETIDVQTDKKRPIELTFRIGPAYEASITLNGPEGAQAPRSLSV
jgi:hypothetical protein